MQLYLASVGRTVADERQLADALTCVAEPFRQLDPATAHTCVSRSGEVKLAVLAHGVERADPRRYFAQRADRAIAFDGLPVDPTGNCQAWNAGALLEQWDACHARLEGQFSVILADLDTDTVLCTTDTLGMSPAYAAQRSGGWLVSNSVEALRLLNVDDAPDALGVSSFLSLGWTVDDRTLIGSVRALRGGTTHRFTTSEATRDVYFSPQAAIRAARARSTDVASTRSFVEELVQLTAGAVVAPGLPVNCAVTAGRDTRVVLALALAAGATPHTGTIGDLGNIDVQLGRTVAEALGLSHTVDTPESTTMFDDAAEASRTFVALTDGLSSLLQLQDISDLTDPPRRLGVQVWGVGGEIARAGTNPLRAVASNAPGIARSDLFQRRLLGAKMRDFGGIVTPAGQAPTTAFLARFIEQRRAEGWRARELSEAFYTFDRVARWGSAGIRRAAALDDLFSPFASRAFITYAFALRSGERFNEAAHYRILSDLDPRLRDLPYENRWPAQRPALAPFKATFAACRPAFDPFVKARRRPVPTAAPPPRFAFTWLERQREVHREICLAHPASPLWEWISRPALERAFASTPYDEETAEGLLRVATLFWYFHRS